MKNVWVENRKNRVCDFFVEYTKFSNNCFSFVHNTEPFFAIIALCIALFKLSRLQHCRSNCEQLTKFSSSLSHPRENSYIPCLSRESSGQTRRQAREHYWAKKDNVKSEWVSGKEGRERTLLFLLSWVTYQHSSSFLGTRLFQFFSIIHFSPPCSLFSHWLVFALAIAHTLLFWRKMLSFRNVSLLRDSHNDFDNSRKNNKQTPPSLSLPFLVRHWIFDNTLLRVALEQSVLVTHFQWLICAEHKKSSGFLTHNRALFLSQRCALLLLV